ncbi:hypothetical protein HY971_01205 [Candidatus Kaiserbacteria bacterium]|nr:hypothetical protein [Candidatus Kaiserbacteria bacterium]
MNTNAHKAGLVGAIMLGGFHVVFSVLILLGWAQPLVNFSMWAHMVQSGPAFLPFDAVASLTVIVVAACIGYAVGFILSTVWNKVHGA